MDGNSPWHYDLRFTSINTESLLLFNDVIHSEFIEIIIKQHGI